MAVNPVVAFSDIDSGINEGFLFSINVDGITLDIAQGEYRFSDYDGSRARVYNKSAFSILPGQQLSTYPDLNSVESSWPALTGNETVHFYVLAENGTVYQTGLSPLNGVIIRDYLTLGATLIDNTTDRNIAALFDFKNINASAYEFSNFITPIFENASSLELIGESDLTFSRSGGKVFFSGDNLSNNRISPSVTEYLSQDPANFLSAHRRNDGTFYLSGFQTDFSPFIGLYDDGNAGPTSTLPVGTLSNNKWTVHYIFFEVSLGVYIIQIGQSIYNNLADIRDSLFLGQERLVIAPFLSGVKNYGYLFVKGDATSLAFSGGQAYFTRLDNRFIHSG